MLRDVTGKRVLLLQGPNGPFFRRFAKELRSRGCEVTKVNFSAGDGMFYRGADVVRFRRPLEEWPGVFRMLAGDRRIEVVFLFGDTKPIHRAIFPVAEELGIAVYALEEGYLRPDFVTIEKGGVNGNSQLPRDASFYRRAAAGLPELPKPVPVGNTFYHHAFWAALHAWAMTLFGWRYPAYRHHRDVNAFRQAALWIRGAFRKVWYAIQERGVLADLVATASRRFFLVPLQVYCDAQIKHSTYERVEDFIEEVVATFAAHAPADTLLVLKHHPHDRAYRDYGATLRRLGAQHGCADRIRYVHDLHLPTLLDHAKGVVTLNSTVGLSALQHGAPVKVLGKAVYDLRGLTSQSTLAEFFVEPGTFDAELLASFVRWLREDNQINGSFYKRLPLGTRCGLAAAAFGPDEAKLGGPSVEEPVLPEATG